MFDRLDALIGIENRTKLFNKTVVVIGVGGVGGYAVESLVRSGIGHVVLIDHDTIDISNKNRQLIALNTTIGMKKVDAFKKRILDINDECQVDIHDVFLTQDNINLLDLYKIDYLIDACDTISTKKAIIDKCIKEKIPFISSMGTGKRLDPSKLEITDLRKTNYDPLARILRKYIKEERINDKITVLCSTEPPLSTGKEAVGSNSFVPSSAGLLITSYIIRSFLNED